jgi:homocysteine S-methyltransferase
MRRMQDVTTPEDSKKVGVEIAAEMVATLGDKVQGVQMSAPFGNIKMALAIIGR